MAQYKEYKGLNLPEIDGELLKYWEEKRVFERSVSEREGATPWIFYEGPPSANGKPGIHHVMARTIKDAFCRYRTLSGYQVRRKGGWDTHGLPIEINVEKSLGITKEDIGKKISVAEYNAECRRAVMEFKDLWDDITRKMGYWVDLDNPYITFDNDYIESVWWVLQQLYKKNYLYKGYTIQPYSPAAGTGLSSHELNQPGCYKPVKDTTVVAMFRVKRDAQSGFLFGDAAEDVRILAWTTTPWTLPSNTALTVGAKITYCKVRTFNPYTGAQVSMVLAKDLIGKWLKAEGEQADWDSYKAGDKVLPYRVEATFSGAELEGVRYEQLLAFGNEIEPLDGKTDAFRVILGDFVTTEDGTGVVHTAPSFGADDRRAARANGIGTLTLVDRQGKFVDTVGPFSGRYVKDYKNEKENYKDVDVEIAIQLKVDGMAFNVQRYEHNYPHCWRTDKPILYYPLDSWFVRASSAKERMAELNKTINWKPESTGTGRFGVWLENLQDWNLSRSRYWGIPLPIWRTKDAQYEVCIGSVAELNEAMRHANNVLHLNQQPLQDLHRPYVDEVVLVSPNGEPMYREADLIDVWFDSGSMPYAQWHYPFENQEIFKQSFPADFIAEGVDQTRGWFYTLHAISTMLFDSVAYKNVVSNGLVLDRNGEKMSKSKGNVVDPFTTIAQYGADATRWYLVSNANPWDNLKFDEEGIRGTQRKLFGTMYNTYSFFALYANIDGYVHNHQQLIPVANRPELDRWIVSKLNSLLLEYRTAMDDYDLTRSARAVENFIDNHLSNWYIRLSRRRFWKGDMSHDKLSAYQTLFECLMVTAQMMSPFAPFFSDWLYKNLCDGMRQNVQTHTPDSIHLTQFAPVELQCIDAELEQRMEYAQRISSMVLSLRKKEKIRVRQPLEKILLPIPDADFQRRIELVQDVIKSEVNVKRIEFLQDDADFLKKRIKADFKALGSRMGKDMKVVADQVAVLTDANIKAFERTGSYTLVANGNTHTLQLSDVLITTDDIPGWLVVNERELTVALDISLTPSLLAEGTARELINRIQNIRKDSNFNVTDRIKVVLEQHTSVLSAVEQFSEYICSEVLATQLQVVPNPTQGELVELFDNVHLKIHIELN